MENDSKDMTIEQLGEQINNLKKDNETIRALVPDVDSKVSQQGQYSFLHIFRFRSALSFMGFFLHGNS